MSETKRRNFVYKVAVFLKDLGDADENLETLLRKAVKKVPKALERAENSDGLEFRFVNYTGTHCTASTSEGLFGCEFLSFEKGADQSTIKLDPNAKEVDVDAITATQGEEFLAGSVYFGIVNNHVILVQSRPLKALDLEKYLNWFLVQKTKVLPGDNRVALSDHVPNKKKLNFKDVQGIEIDAPVHLRPTTDEQVSNEKALVTKSADKSMSVEFFGKAWDALKALIGDGVDFPSEIDVDDLAKAPNLEVKLYLSWKATKKEDDHDLMGAIAKQMSHVDEEFDYTVHTRTGKIGKEDFKLFQGHNFAWEKGRPKFDDLFPKMAVWLASLVKSGKVSV